MTTGDFSFRVSSNPKDDKLSERPAEGTLSRDDTGLFRILLCGDFSGRVNRGTQDAATLGSRKIHGLTVDNFARVMHAVGPRLALPLGEGKALELAFEGMEDFRPEALMRQVPALQALSQLRAGLLDPATARETAEKVRPLAGIRLPAAPAAPREAGEAAVADGGSDLARLLAGPARRKAAPAGADALIAGLVANSSAPDPEPDQQALVAFVEDALSLGLRVILRHPAFQALEAAWRGVHLLASRVDTDGALKFALLDASKEELAADLAAGEASALGQRLRDQTGRVLYALVAGDYVFDAGTQDFALLQRLGEVMRAADAAFIGGAAPGLAGSRSWDELAAMRTRPVASAELEALRGSAGAGHVGLAGPRFLARLPYGPGTDEIDGFPFFEMKGAGAGAELLWTNGAFAVAHAVAVAASQAEGQEDIRAERELADLPMYAATVDGEMRMAPCAEAWLSERAANALDDIGIMPMVALRNAAAVRIAGIHSIAGSDKPLAGRRTIL